MKFNQDLNPFTKDDAMAHALASILLKGDEIEFYDLKAKAGGASTRTLGRVRTEFAKSGVAVISKRYMTDQGLRTFYTVEKAGKTTAAPKAKQAKVKPEKASKERTADNSKAKSDAKPKRLPKAKQQKAKAAA